VDEETARQLHVMAGVMITSLEKLGRGPAAISVVTWPGGQITVMGCTGDPGRLVAAYRAQGCTVEALPRTSCATGVA
jgi:hypothetical protein